MHAFYFFDWCFMQYLGIFHLHLTLDSTPQYCCTISYIKYHTSANSHTFSLNATLKWFKQMAVHYSFFVFFLNSFQYQWMIASKTIKNKYIVYSTQHMKDTQAQFYYKTTAMRSNRLICAYHSIWWETKHIKCVISGMANTDQLTPIHIVIFSYSYFVLMLQDLRYKNENRTSKIIREMQFLS